MLFSISTLNNKTVMLCPLGHKTPQAANVTQGHNTQNKQHNLLLEALNDLEPYTVCWLPLSLSLMPIPQLELIPQSPSLTMSTVGVSIWVSVSGSCHVKVRVFD